MFGNVGSIRFIRICSIFIMVIAAVLSFGNQRKLLTSWGVDSLSSMATPVTIDLLAIICTLAIHTEGVARSGRRAAIIVLLIAGSTAGTANFMSGGSLGSKVTHVWSVLAYLLSEWIAAKVRGESKTVDAKRSEAAKKAAVTRATNRAQKAKSQAKRRAVAAAVADANVIPLRQAAAAN